MDNAADCSPRPPAEGDADQPLGLGLNWSDPSSPLARFHLRVGHVVAVALIVGAFVLYSRTPLWHTDLWGHLTFGRWIVEHQGFPTAEPFTPHGQRTEPIGHFNWLSQVAGFLIFRSGADLAGDTQQLRQQGGAEALRLVYALTTAILLVLLFKTYLRRGESLALAVTALVTVLILSLWVFAVQRPQIVGLVLFAAVLFALSRPVLSRRALLLIPLIFAVWANAHGSYAIGLMLLGVFLAGRLIEVLAATGPRWKALRDAQVLRLAGVLALSGLAVALLNPHGTEIFPLTLALSRHPNIRQLEEWSPLAFEWGPGGHWGYMATLLIILGSQLLSRQALTPTSLLVIVSFGLLPCVQQRMMVWWTLLWPWVVLPLWTETSARWFGPSTADKPGGSLLWTLVVCVLIGIGLVLSPAVQWLLSGTPRTPLEQLLSSGTPHRLGSAAEVQGRVFCSETQGDYLVWDTAPGRDVLVYTHAHLFPPEHWSRCMETKFGEPGWRENLDRWRANLVVIEPRLHPQLAELLRKDPAWEVTLDEANDQSIRDPRNARFVARRKNPL